MSNVEGYLEQLSDKVTFEICKALILLDFFFELMDFKMCFMVLVRH